MTTRIPGCLRAASLSVILFAASCGGGNNGSAAPAVNLTGYWQLYLTPTGWEELGPSAVFLSQTGGTLDGAGITGVVSGTNFSATSSPGPFVVNLNGTASDTLATGNLALSGGINATGTFRMVKFAPAGTMSVSGTIQNLTVNMTSTAAIGSRDYSDHGFTQLEEVEITLAYGSEHLEVTFSPTGLAVGALAVPGTVTANVTYRNDVVNVELDASGGTVTVTKYDGTGFAGSLTLTLPGGGTLTGSFDVAWDIAAYEP